MKGIILAASLLFASTSSAEGILDVNKLNQTLLKTKAGWVARETSLSQLSREELKHRMGLRRSTSPDVQFRTNRQHVETYLPTSLDWRNKDGNNWVTPMLDQANCGSCVAFAAVATLETQYRIDSGFANFNVKFSPQYLFSCGGGRCDWGWMPSSAAAFLQRTGAPDEACMPYKSGATGADVSCRAACSNSTQRNVKISSYTMPTRNALDIGALKQALQHGPLVTTLDVYADFVNYSSGVYKHVSGGVLGGHAVSIIGYDDTTRSILIRNSWGHEWGEGGFGRVSYDDVSGVGDETWSYTVPSMAGAVTVESPIDYSYFTGEVALKSTSTFNPTDTVSVSFFDQNGNATWNGTCSGSGCNQAVDVSTLPDGKYEVQATAMDASGNALGRSNRQFFYIANNTKQAVSLTFTGAKGTDLSKPLKDRIEIAITPRSGAVPMSSIDFHYRGPDGVDHVRSASVVLDGMTMGWRTNLVPNGAYEIWLVGHVKTNTFDNVIETAHLTVQTSN